MADTGIGIVASLFSLVYCSWSPTNFSCGCPHFYTNTNPVAPLGTIIGKGSRLFSIKNDVFIGCGKFMKIQVKFWDLANENEWGPHQWPPPSLLPLGWFVSGAWRIEAPRPSPRCPTACAVPSLRRGVSLLPGEWDWVTPCMPNHTHTRCNKFSVFGPGTYHEWSPLYDNHRGVYCHFVFDTLGFFLSPFFSLTFFFDWFSSTFIYLLQLSSTINVYTNKEWLQYSNGYIHQRNKIRTLPK